MLKFRLWTRQCAADHWCQHHRGAPFDAGAPGRQRPVQAGCFARLLAELYFARPAPKSVGRDLFHPEWLAAALEQEAPPLAPQDAGDPGRAHGESGAGRARCGHRGAYASIVCGGGALNAHLMARLAALLPGGGRPVVRSPRPAAAAGGGHGLAGAPCRARRELGNLASVMGARGPRVLGALYPA